MSKVQTRIVFTLVKKLEDNTRGMKQMDKLMMIKDKTTMIRNSSEFQPHEFLLGELEIDWLIEQAEWAKHYGGKAGNLNKFLQKRLSDRVGDNVIDVAMDYIRYLEKELNN